MIRHRLAAALLLLCLLAPPSSRAGYDAAGLVLTHAVGKAVYNPTTAKTFASTPVSGVVMPAGTVIVVLRVETNPIRYWSAATPTGTDGLLLAPGYYTLGPDNPWLKDFTFIDSSAGPSTCFVQYEARR